VPILSTKSKDTDDEPNDKSYRPPKHSNALDNEAPGCIYASDGEEVITETEYGRELVGQNGILARQLETNICISTRKRSGNENARLTTKQTNNHEKKKFSHISL